MGKVYFGIDLGTSSSSISYIADSLRRAQGSYIEPTTIKFSPPPGGSFFENWQRLPSMLYVEQKGGKNQVVTGFQAAEAAGGKLAKPFANLFMSVKSDMGTQRVYDDSVHPDILTPVDVSAEIIRELVRAAEKETGISPKESPVVITVPASFTHSQRQDTLRAARLAGLTLDEGALLDEPVAAFICTASHQNLDMHLDLKDPKYILVFDLGAGTCDVSVFEAVYSGEAVDSGVGLQINNLAISNYEKLGGDNIDLYIVRDEVMPVFCDRNGLDFDNLPEKVKRELRFRLKLKAKEIKEAICRQMTHGWGKKQIRQPWKVDAFPLSALGMKMKKADDVIKLESFMQIMRPFVTDDLKDSLRISDDYLTYSFFGPVFSALERAGLDPEDINGFIFNGGSCHNPVIKQAFQTHARFSGASFFDTPDLDLSVSRGAAIHCYHLHRNGTPLVRPIVNADIGIYTLGLKKEQLVAAGTALPYPQEGQFVMTEKFCVPREGMTRVTVPVYAGAGTVISSLKLPLPEGTKKGEPISIGLRMDCNKMLSVTAFMTHVPDIRTNAELSNPWTHRIQTPKDMAVDELWQQVSEMKKQKLPVSPQTLIHLANQERLRGKVDVALEILQRLEDRGHDSAALFNIMGLCYDRRGLKDKALQCFRQAATLDQNNITYATNYGSQLFECGNIEEAVSRLREAVNMNPDSYLPYYWLGHTYRKQGDEAAAKKELMRAQQILKVVCSREPDDEYYLDCLRDVELALGQYDEADKSKKKLQDLRNSKILGSSPDDLIAGPSSGLWKEDELFEAENQE